MGDLSEDTAVQGENGQYTARLVDHWGAGFGPIGGYLAAIALRAAGSEGQLPRPASFGCHYLAPADFSPVTLSVQRVFAGKRAESLRVSMTQQERRILEATVWNVADVPAVFEEHEALPMPWVPAPETLKELTPAPPPIRHPPFWRNIDQRLVGWPGWDAAGEPRIGGWYRYRPRPVMENAFAEAARSVIIVDLATWYAAMNPHVERTNIIAPTMMLSVRFYRPGRTEWLHCQARSDIAVDGLIDGVAAVWSSDGKLVAQGGAQMVYRSTMGHRP